MEVSKTNFASFMGNKILAVPIYQRNYAWEIEHLTDLWDDLYYLGNGKKHYFGTIYLINIGTERIDNIPFEKYEIMDGQQRIISLLILINEIILKMKDLPNQAFKPDTLERYVERFFKIGNHYFLEISPEDNPFFQQNIIDNISYPMDISRPSQRRLLSAKAFFRKKIEDELNQKGLDKQKKFLSDLFEKVSESEFMQYPIKDDSEAVLIFETINDRGKKLSDLEKTKSLIMRMTNLLLSKGVDKELEKIKISFDRIYNYIDKIQISPFDPDLEEDALQRYQCILFDKEILSSDPETGEKLINNYFNFLKKKIRTLSQKNPTECFDYISRYYQDLEKCFFALNEICSYAKNNEVRKLLEKIHRLGRIAVFYPVLLASWIKFNDNEEALVDLLKQIETMSFRMFAIGQRRSDTGRDQLYRLANSMYNSEIDETTGYHYFNKLYDILCKYQDDHKFKENLNSSSFYEDRASNDIKYLFLEYENDLSKGAKEPLTIKSDEIFTPTYSIEHIWAQDATIADAAEELEHQNNVHKLGNLTLASQSWNSSWGNEPFDRKVPEYTNSSLRVQRNLSTFNHWREQEIKDRTQQLVAFCLERWKLRYITDPKHQFL